MINRFNRKEFYRHVNGQCSFKSFPGANSKDLNHYVIPTLNNVKPDVALIHVGTNDVRKRNGNFRDENEIANEILEVGRNCRKNGVNKVFVSSIVCRRKPEENDLVQKINRSVMNMCVNEGYIFVDNSSIGTDHFWNDGFHILTTLVLIYWQMILLMQLILYDVMIGTRGWE